MEKDLSQELLTNLNILVDRINSLQIAYGKDFIINSGYRSPEINAATSGSSPHSWHMKCAAIDIADKNDELMNWTLQNLDKVKEIGFWMESFNYTPDWVHYQIYPPHSGNRIFIPSLSPAPSKRWDGKID